MAAGELTNSADGAKNKVNEEKEEDFENDNGSARSFSTLSIASAKSDASTETLLSTQNKVKSDENKNAIGENEEKCQEKWSTLPPGAVEYRIKIRQKGFYVMAWRQENGETHVSLCWGPFGRGVLGEFVAPNKSDGNNLSTTVDTLPFPRSPAVKFWMVPQPLGENKSEGWSLVGPLPRVFRLQSLASKHFIGGWDKYRLHLNSKGTSDYSRFELEPVSPGISMGVYRLVFHHEGNFPFSTKEDAVFEMLKNDDEQTFSFKLTGKEGEKSAVEENGNGKRPQSLHLAVGERGELTLCDYWEVPSSAKKFWLHQIPGREREKFALKSVAVERYLALPGEENGEEKGCPKFDQKEIVADGKVNENILALEIVHI